MRSYRACLRHTAIAVLLTVSLASAASANPLLAQRQAMGQENPASVSLAVPVISSASSGHAILGIGAAALLQYGLLSGEPVAVTIGARLFRAHVAFKDEIERAANYYASTGKPEPFDPGVRLVLDRLDPNAAAELDTRTGGAEMPLGADSGQVIMLQFVPAAPGGRAFPR